MVRWQTRLAARVCVPKNEEETYTKDCGGLGVSRARQDVRLCGYALLPALDATAATGIVTQELGPKCKRRRTATKDTAIEIRSMMHILAL